MLALQMVQNRHYDLVLMDCHMPVMDGYQATREIRALPTAVADIPIVALSASVMPEDQEKCRLAGMNDFLSKPLRQKDLESAVAARRRTPEPAVAG